ncbi:MAG: Two-component system, OmpR family, sensor kinase [Rhodospirillales bacterium]|nr:Two-component system, OmpR family, sensor kinase [Rhodospirillales bacterium]
MANRSIASRLIWLIASALAVVWILGSVAAALLSRFEVNERLDNALEEVAQRLMPVVDGSYSEPEAMQSLGEHILPAVDPRAIAYQILGSAGQIILRSPNAPDEPFNGTPQTGFYDTPHYRIYTAPATRGPYWLEVAEPQIHRHEAIGRAIELAILPLLAFLPLSWIVIRWAVRRSFWPLIKLQSEIGTRSGTNLARIPDLEFPAELAPIHTAVNRLLERLERALITERQFAANSAHELRTPIAGALAQMQVLSAQLNDPRHVERAGVIIRQIKGLGELTEKLLQLSRAGAGLALTREPVDLVPAVKVLVDEFRRQDGLSERLEIELGNTSEFIVHSDIDVLGIAIRNLLENAARYGSSDEPIHVFVRGHTIGVASGGPVLSPDLLAVLTQPFQRGTTVGQGRGLGLAIVNSIMQQVGGALRLSSPPDGCSAGFEALLIFPQPELVTPVLVAEKPKKRRQLRSTETPARESNRIARART